METLLVKTEGSVTFVTLNRPNSLNALNTQMLDELKSLIPDLGEQVVIFTGSEKAFSAGADIKEIKGMDENKWQSFCALGNGVMDAIEEAPFIAIAAVNGYCLGGGLELAMACDFIFAKEDAVFGLPEVTLGLIPSFGGVRRSIEAMGKRRAKELMMTGRHFLAEEGLQWGLITQICSHLLPECRSFAETICQNDQEVIHAIKRWK